MQHTPFSFGTVRRKQRVGKGRRKRAPTIQPSLPATYLALSITVFQSIFSLCFWLCYLFNSCHVLRLMYHDILFCYTCSSVAVIGKLLPVWLLKGLPIMLKIFYALHSVYFGAFCHMLMMIPYCQLLLSSALFLFSKSLFMI